MHSRSRALPFPHAGRKFTMSAMFLMVCGMLSLVVLPNVRAATVLDLSRAFAPPIFAGDPARQQVALTFDDGPNPDATPRILDELERAHIHATFFVVGRLVQAYPDIVARMVRDGDAVESHSWAHEYTVLEFPKAFRRSLQATDAAIESAGGGHPRFFRPPYGVRTPWTVEQARADGENVVLWSVPLSDDWDQPGTNVIVERTLAYAKPGAIIVLHDGNEGELCAGTRDCDRRQEIAAAPILIRQLTERRLRFVTLPEMFPPK